MDMLTYHVDDTRFSFFFGQKFY